MLCIVNTLLACLKIFPSKFMKNTLTQNKHKHMATQKTDEHN